MEVLKLILTILQVLGSLFLITVVLLQSGKRQGLSGAIGGGAETFFGKNKGRAMDAILSKATTVVAIVRRAHDGDQYDLTCPPPYRRSKRASKKFCNKKPAADQRQAFFEAVIRCAPRRAAFFVRC